MCLHYDKQFAPTRITTINPFADVVPRQRNAETATRRWTLRRASDRGEIPVQAVKLEAHLLFDYKQQRVAAERREDMEGGTGAAASVERGHKNHLLTDLLHSEAPTRPGGCLPGTDGTRWDVRLGFDNKQIRQQQNEEEGNNSSSSINSSNRRQWATAAATSRHSDRVLELIIVIIRQRCWQLHGNAISVINLVSSCAEAGAAHWQLATTVQLSRFNSRLRCTLWVACEAFAAVETIPNSLASLSKNFTQKNGKMVAEEKEEEEVKDKLRVLSTVCRSWETAIDWHASRLMMEILEYRVCTEPWGECRWKNTRRAKRRRRESNENLREKLGRY